MAADLGTLVATISGVVAAGGAAAATEAFDGVRKWSRRVVPTKADTRLAGSGSAEDPDGLVETILTVRSWELTLEERLAELADLMIRSATLVEQASAELDARAATAQKLQEEAKQAEELASVNREQAEAIRKLVDAELAERLTDNGAAIRKDVRRDAIRIGLGSFVAGDGLTWIFRDRR